MCKLDMWCLKSDDKVVWHIVIIKNGMKINFLNRQKKKVRINFLDGGSIILDFINHKFLQKYMYSHKSF